MANYLAQGESVVEASLRSSRSEVVAQALKNLTLKVEIGYFDTRNLKRVEIRPKLADCLEMMYSFEDLRMKLENTRAIRYDLENNTHETKLLEIWKNFMHPEELSGRKSRQWQYLGFQGNDPSTDFRASGELGLNFILYFSRTYQERAKQVLGVSNHPMYSFPLAILMIQIVETGFSLFRHGQAKTHFYNRHSTILSLDEGAKAVDFITRAQGLVGIFYDFCCVLLIEFSRFWLSKKPKNIMAFPPIYEEFVNVINERLKDDDTVFLMDIQNI
ncbi:ELMO domain-containing protein 2 [Orchesella cincta]|uniref:ELMO domain-containing protein 2 n=1 Tax=Orchesella cincta TaxID=48709 RepID=A0A1D2MN67_ORCCI|nr:ELMO domain-containing protein 2 [Orchesella cincta]